jgi:hypothetical protein
MLSQQYSHRLPADYDMALIRRRVAERGPLWDDTKGLAFKAFVVRERGRFGAVGNAYSSVYLWRDPAAAVDFVMGDRFQAVIDGFGRPGIETQLPLHAGAGSARLARTLYREDIPIDDHADRKQILVDEIGRNEAALKRDDIVAVVSAIDVSTWRLIRLAVSAAPADPARAGRAYEVLYLATPELDALR